MTDWKTIFQNNARISNPASARCFRIELGLLRKAARLLPLAPGVLEFRGVYYIPGHDDALAALAGDAMFATPYKQAMQLLDTAAKVSLLGFDQTEDSKYQKNLCQVMRSMPLDMVSEIGESAAGETRARFKEKGLRLDFMDDLVIPVTLKVLQQYFGVSFDDDNAAGKVNKVAPGKVSEKERDYLKWTMASLIYVFGPPGGPDYKRDAARAAGKLMDECLDLQIKEAEPSDLNVLGRLLKSKGSKCQGDDGIRATLAALLVGAIPTLTQAAYNILKVLLAQPLAMKMARHAAQEDDEYLGQCLYEALRFRPVLPVFFRKCVIPAQAQRNPKKPEDYLRGPVDWLGRHIPGGATVGILSVTANLDPRGITAPEKFDPLRPRSDNLVFGQGRHWCLGVPMSMAVLVSIFKPLLLAGAIRPRKLSTTRYFMDYFAQNFDIIIDPDSE